jgi:hypothetical protein
MRTSLSLLWIAALYCRLLTRAPKTNIKSRTEVISEGRSHAKERLLPDTRSLQGRFRRVDKEGIQATCEETPPGRESRRQGRLGEVQGDKWGI